MGFIRDTSKEFMWILYSNRVRYPVIGWTETSEVQRHETGEEVRPVILCEGHVRVVRIDEGSIVKCDEDEWHVFAEKSCILKALPETGKVRV